MQLKEAGNVILNILYPPRCMVCGRLIGENSGLCPDCTGKIPRISGKRCARCGKPVEEEEELCGDCASKPHVCEEGFGAFRYDDVMRELISSFKYEGHREYAAPLGRLCYEEAWEKLEAWKPDALIPVPLHRQRLLKRGFNQAELLAEELARRSGIPLRRDLLIRTGKTGALKLLGAKERSRETEHAFSLAGNPAGMEKVILVDDIYTTGATVDSAARPLLAGGVGQVFFLTVCIGSGFMVEW